MMAGPNWAHWHGFFELQRIDEKRLQSGEIEK